MSAESAVMGVSVGVVKAVPAEELSECYQELVSLAGRKFGSIPSEQLARHVMGVCHDVDWPVRRAALEALQRRYAAVKGEGLRVARRPKNGKALGTYQIKADTGLKPYVTVLRSATPVVANCTCPDYLRSSLGVCKHIFTVLEELFSKPVRVGKVQKEQEKIGCLETSYLLWDPVRPAVGTGDFMERVIWHRSERDDPAWSSRVIPTLAKYFEARDGSSFVIKSQFLKSTENRLKTVSALLSFISSSSDDGPYADLFTDQALCILLKEERARLTRTAKDGLSKQQIRTLVQGLKKKLYRYQLEGIERFIQAERLLLADDMGLGKTVQAIAACHLLWTERKVKRGLLIVPAALKAQWMREWLLFSDSPIQIVEGKPEERKELYAKTKNGFLIANYEQVLKDLAIMHEWQPQMIVLDEAQRIKNWSTKTATYIKRLQPRWRLVLTGTPMENRLSELASVVEWVDSFALEPKWRLIPWHSQYIDGRSEVGGARNLNTIRERLAHCMVRRIREEVLNQLPPRTDTRVPVMLTDAQLEAHDALSEPILKLVAISKKRPLNPKEFLKLMSLFLMQRVISNGMAQYQFEEIWPDLRKIANPSERFLETLDSPKLLELRELVEQVVINQGRKVVIFSQWTRMLQLAHWCIKPLLDRAGASAVFFTGKEGQRRRTQNIVDFHDEPRVQVLLASDAGGVGLNLQRAASCCINIELPWNPAVLEQRIGRIYRLGQSQHVNIYNLVNEIGIEARIASLVSGKQALFKGLFDGDSNEVHYREDGGWMAQLEKMVEPIVVPALKNIPHSDQYCEEGTDDIFEQSTISCHCCEEVDTDQRELKESSGSAEATAAQERGGEGNSLIIGSQAKEPLSEAARVLQTITIERSGEGELKIKAPPEAISSLCTLFESLAEQLRRA